MYNKKVLSFIVIILVFFAFSTKVSAEAVVRISEADYKYSGDDQVVNVQKRFYVDKLTKEKTIAYCIKNSGDSTYRCKSTTDICSSYTAVGSDFTAGIGGSASTVCPYATDFRPELAPSYNLNVSTGSISSLLSGIISEYKTQIPDTYKTSYYMDFTCKYADIDDPTQLLEVEYLADGTNKVLYNGTNINSKLVESVPYSQTDAEKFQLLIGVYSPAFTYKSNVSSFYLNNFDVKNFNDGNCPAVAYYKIYSTDAGIFLTNEGKAPSKRWYYETSYKTAKLTNVTEVANRVMPIYEKAYNDNAKAYLLCSAWNIDNGKITSVDGPALLQKINDHQITCLDNATPADTCFGTTDSLVSQTKIFMTDNNSTSCSAQYDNFAAASQSLLNKADEYKLSEYSAKYSDIKDVKDCEILGTQFKAKLQTIFTGIKLLVVVGLVIFGMLDFSKAVMSGEADAFKKATKRFTNRVIIAILIFFLPIIIDFLVTNALGDKITKSCIQNF